MDDQTEVASRSTWENHSIDQPIRIPIELSFTTRQVETLKKGHIPIEMEDKWFIFYENGWLYFHRSWTGFGTYKAELSESSEGCSIKEFWAERNPEKHKNTDDQEDIDSIVLLITKRLLHGDISDEIRRKYVIPYYDKLREMLKPESEQSGGDG